MKRLCILLIILAGLIWTGCTTQGPNALTTATPADTAGQAGATTAAGTETASPEPSPEATASPMPAPTPSPTPSFPAELGVAELEFVFEGQSFTLNTDIQPLLDTLGGEYEQSETPSKLYSGKVKTYDYGDIIFTTYPLDGKDALGEVEITGEGYQTRRGIMIGDSPDMVIEAYGDEFNGGNEQMTYLLGTGSGEQKTPRIIFEVVDDIVVCIRFYGTAEVK